MLNSKVIIGTANFDQQYGIRAKRVDKQKIKEIIQYASKNNINKFDTSASYKNAEKILGRLLKKNSKVITKLPPIPNNLSIKNTEIWISKKIKESQKKLKIKNLYALLLHKPDILLTAKGIKIYEFFLKEKKKGNLKKFGVSIYNFNILKKILKLYKIDIAQVPFNVFDQRLIKEKNLINKKNNKIEIHCRSIYFQGLLLQNEKKLSNKFKKFKIYWKKWDSWLKINQLTPMQANLNFISQNIKCFKNIVVGFDSRHQLEEFINYRYKKEKLNFNKFHIKNKKFNKPSLLKK